MEPGILFTERRFGLLELHSRNLDEVREAGEAVLAGIGAKPSDQLAPATLYTDIVEDVSDQHAIILNRMRNASMILPRQSLLLYEMAPRSLPRSPPTRRSAPRRRRRLSTSR